MSNEDIKAMSDVDLMDSWTALGAQVEDDKARLKAFSAEYQDRCAMKQAVDALGSEAVTKIQSMEPVGVPSEEVVAGVEGGTVEEGADL